MVSQSTTADTKQIRLDRLREFAIVDAYADSLSNYLGDTFRLKHTENLDRSAVYVLKEHGIVHESEKDLGRVIDWELTEYGADLTRTLIDDEEEIAVPILTDDTLSAIERHPVLLLDFPSDTEEEWMALDFALNSSLLACLRRNGLIEREQQRTGVPDVWTVTEKLIEVQEYLSNQGVEAE
jgi:hypothetical protein